MKKIVVGLCLSFILLTSLTLWLILQKSEGLSLDRFIKQRWPQLLTRFSDADNLDLTYLLSDARPAELTNVELQIAHFQNFDLVGLQNLFNLSRNCQQRIIRPKSKELQKPWLWIAATCFQQKLPKDFFKKPPFLFPSGQSYIQLAENLKFDFSDYLTNDEIKIFKSSSEMMQMSPVGSDLNLQQLHGFLQGEDILIGENFIYLKSSLPSETSRTRIYQRVPLEIWRSRLRAESFIFTDLISESCLLTTTNGCWVTHRHAAQANRQLYLTIVLILDGVIFVMAAMFFWVDRRWRQSQKENQRFTLQMLTHELRTPVTTLSLQLENIRHDFDQLNPNHQIEFLKMSQEITRLKNSMQMSYAYLQTDAIQDNKLKMTFEKLDLKSILQKLIADNSSTFHKKNLQFESDEATAFVYAELQWLILCVNNLIQNAFDHGHPPV